MADFEQEPDLVQVQQPEADEGLEESLAEFFQTPHPSTQVSKNPSKASSTTLSELAEEEQRDEDGGNVFPEVVNFGDQRTEDDPGPAQGTDEGAAPQAAQEPGQNKPTTSKVIGAAKTNFKKFVAKLMAGQLTNLQYPIEETQPPTLLASVQMLDKQWRDFQEKVIQELENLSAAQGTIEDTLLFIREGEYGELYRSNRGRLTQGLVIQDQQAQRRRIEEEQEQKKDKRRPVLPPQNFLDDTSSEEDSTESLRPSPVSFHARQQQDDFEKQCEEAANYQPEPLESTPKDQPRNPEVDRAQQWRDENAELLKTVRPGVLDPQNAVRRAEVAQTHLQPQVEDERASQTSQRSIRQVPELQSASPITVQSSQPRITPAEEDMRETVNQLRNAGHEQAAQQFAQEEAKRIRKMNAQPIQLYEVPEELMHNIISFIWNEADALNWPENVIMEKIALFEKEKKFPGGLPLQGRFAELQFKPKPRIDTVVSPNVVVSDEVRAANERLQAQLRADKERQQPVSQAVSYTHLTLPTKA